MPPFQPRRPAHLGASARSVAGRRIGGVEQEAAREERSGSTPCLVGVLAARRSTSRSIVGEDAAHHQVSIDAGSDERPVEAAQEALDVPAMTPAAPAPRAAVEHLDRDSASTGHEEAVVTAWPEMLLRRCGTSSASPRACDRRRGAHLVSVFAGPRLRTSVDARVAA